MTKIAVVFMVLLLPCLVRADDSMLGQMLDAQIASLEREYSEKMSVLQQCEKETKGFKIAGITTLTLTGVGIYANQKLSEKLKQSSTGGGGTGGPVGVIDNRSQSDKDCESAKDLFDIGLATQEEVDETCGSN